MVDTNIAMRGVPIDTATPIRQMQQDQNANAQSEAQVAGMNANTRNTDANTAHTNAMSPEQVLKAHYDNMGERDKRRLQGTIVGAAQLKTYLDKGDVEGAHDFLVQRQASLRQRQALGEDIDTQETDYALDKLRKGDLQGLQNDVGAMMAAGQAYGMVGGQDGTPSSVREWQYYNSLSDADQKRWRDQKRAGSNIDLGDKVIRLDAGGKPETNYNKGLAPADQPANAEAKAAAVATGTANGENTATAQNTIGKMGGLMSALENLKTSSVKAPSGVIEGLGAQVANKSGLGGDAANAQGDFQVKRAAAENEIRAAFRVAGSGSQSDADAKPFIEMLPVAEDAESVKASKTTAAMEAVRTKVSNLARSRNLPDPFSDGGAAPQAGGSGQVKVSNGAETLLIDAADLAAAQAEGFKQVQ